MREGGEDIGCAACVVSHQTHGFQCHPGLSFRHPRYPGSVRCGGPHWQASTAEVDFISSSLSRCMHTLQCSLARNTTSSLERQLKRRGEEA